MTQFNEHIRINKPSKQSNLTSCPSKQYLTPIDTDFMLIYGRRKAIYSRLKAICKHLMANDKHLTATDNRDMTIDKEQMSGYKELKPSATVLECINGSHEPFGKTLKPFYRTQEPSAGAHKQRKFQF